MSAVLALSHPAISTFYSAVGRRPSVAKHFVPAPPFDENLSFDYLSYVVISCYRIAYRREAPSNNSLVVKLSKNVPRPPQNHVFLGGRGTQIGSFSFRNSYMG